MERMQAEPSRAPQARAPLIPVFAGFALALPFVPFFQMHPDGAFDILALILAATGAVYLGAALQSAGRARLALEWLFATALVLLGALGLWWTPLWLALGFVLHGVWDLAHHTGAVSTAVRRWYPPFSAAWSWAVAAMLVYFS